MDSEDDKQCLEEENNVPALNIIPVQLIEINRDDEVPESSPSPTTISSLVRGKLKYYKQTYRPAWEQMPDFKGWLRGVEGEPTRAYCTYCQKTLHAHRLSLLKHTCTIRHQKAAQIHKTRRFITVNKPHQHPSQQQIDAGTESEQSITSDATPNVVINDMTEDQEVSMATTEGDADETQVVVEYTEATEIEEVEHEDTEADERDEYDEDEDDEETMVAEYVDVRKNVANQGGNGKPPISTHVVDTTKGLPVSGLSVSLYKLIDGRWTYINEGSTSASGKFAQFISRTDFTAGRYKLHYDVDRYFETKKQESIYPFIEIVFDCSFSDSYHIPILLSPYGYTTYRGS